MAALKIVIGYDAKDRPSAVYIGKSGSEAEAAMGKDSKSERFEVFNNPIGVRKSNPNGPSRKAEAKPEKKA